jgi:hypothetical protein
MSSVDCADVYYPISWIKTTADIILSLFSRPQKSKRSLPEEAECGSIEGIKCWLREGMLIQFNLIHDTNNYFFF